MEGRGSTKTMTQSRVQVGGVPLTLRAQRPHRPKRLNLLSTRAQPCNASVSHAAIADDVVGGPQRNRAAYQPATSVVCCL